MRCFVVMVCLFASMVSVGAAPKRVAGAKQRVAQNRSARKFAKDINLKLVLSDARIDTLWPDATAAQRTNMKKKAKILRYLWRQIATEDVD